jgi:tetratricopeptide (TPR) repeat protein
MLVMKNFRMVLTAVVTLAVGSVCLPNAFAQRGRGGGARPSMGNMGGGGARPSMPKMSRPSMPNMSRPSVPNMSRPSMPNMSRPSVARPNVPSRPSFGNANARPSVPNRGGNLGGLSSIGGSRPSLGGAGKLPNVNRPTTLPSNPSLAARPSLPAAPSRPTVRPPNVQLPTSRPSTGIGQIRPSLPGGGERPSLGNVNRPSTLPGIATRPGIGSDRPTTLPGNIDRPMIGGNRPNVNLPNINRPSVGNNVVNRPSIGGNRPVIGNDTNINIGNNVNIGNSGGNRFPNRPNWDVDPGFSRPAWGLNGGNNWNSNWHNNCINHHHNWYNGCWHGYWGSNWYAPVVWGGIGWGLGSMTNGWGYNYASYYNPYYAEPMIAQSMPYDYSQPVIVNNYVSSTSEVPGSEPQAAQSTQQQEQALSSFDQGLEKFKAGQYVAALSDFNAALKVLPGDAVVHEVRSLALFANGDYKAAAAGLNSLLSSAPGMDWTTMSGLYGNPEDYKYQLRNLEKFCKSNPTDASAHFVLAYHCLVTGSKDAAISALQVVVENQPKDVTAKRMLDAMVPTEMPAAAPIAVTGSTARQTDLVGAWMAQSRDTRIDLSISEDSQFTWKAAAKNQTPVVLTGQLLADNDGISLETKEQGSIGGTVESKGPDNWRFAISGSPATDPGLSFTRVK